MLIIAVTGSPGAGKTYFSQIIKQNIKKVKIFELNDIVKKYKIFTIDKENEKIANIKKLNEIVKQYIKNIKQANNKKALVKGLIFVGHLAPELNITFDYSFIIRINLKIMEQRLKKRNYNQNKIKENIISEALDYCGIKINNISNKTYELETNTEKQNAIKFLEIILNNNKKQIPTSDLNFRIYINKMPELLKLIKNQNIYKF